MSDDIIDLDAPRFRDLFRPPRSEFASSAAAKKAWDTRGRKNDVGGDRREGARNEDRPKSRAALNGTNEPLPTLPPANLNLGEVQAVETYMGIGIIVNQSLRRGNLSDRNAATVEQLDSAFEQSPGFTEDTVVHRLFPRELVTPERPGWGDPPPFTDVGYLSTSIDRNQLAGVAQLLEYESSHVEIEVVVPAGTPAIRVSDSRFQDEVLLPRGGTLVPIEGGEKRWRFEMS